MKDDLIKQQIFNEYKILGNRVNEIIQISKNNYYQSQIPNQCDNFNNYFVSITVNILKNRKY